MPSDEDIIRDVGFIQGILDGNLLGDPIHAEAWRWYPPLFHAVAAAAISLTGADLLTTWVRAGAWTNLAAPFCFWVMAARLLGRWPAVAATMLLTLAGGALMRSDEVAAYTPVLLTPALGWPLCFLGLWFMLPRIAACRWRDAALVGAVLGIAFLGHTVPALLLSVVAAAVALATRGLRSRTIAWLAMTAGVELAVGSVFLLPLLADYRLHIANPVPGAWVHDLLRPENAGRLLLLNLPGLLALPLLATLDRTPAAALAAWIGTCVLFLARHYACLVAAGGTVCRVLPIPPHHFHAYLQAAWACLLALALWQLVRRLPMSAMTALGGAAALAGCTGMFGLAPDDVRRAAAVEHPDAVLDRAAYRWILAATAPHDLFVTLLPGEPDRMGASVATVFAAGRRLVAPPQVHSNPYLAWEPMNARRLDYLGGSDAARCRFAAAAGPDAQAWYLLPLDAPAPPAPLVFRSAQHALYRVDAAGCAPAHP